MRTDRADFPTRVAAAVAVAAAAGGAAAQTGPYAGGSVSYTHDSNVYRLADGTEPPPGTPRSDRITSASVMAGLRLPLGRQVLSADASLRSTRYADHASLDHDGHRVALGLDWATVERLSGSASLSRERTLVRFDSDAALSGVPTLQRNLATITHAEAVARIGLITRWSAELGATADAVDYSAPAFRPRDFRQSGVSAGLRHRASDALSMGLGLRATRGRYPHFAQGADGGDIADRYHGRHVDWDVRWVPGDVSRIDARLSLGRTTFDRATASDVSGATGQLLWTWRPTTRLRLETRLARERGQDSSALYFPGSGRYADFSRTTTSLGTAIYWQMTAKVQWVAGLAGAERQLVDTRQDLAGATTLRTGDDRTRVGSLGVRWQPLRTVTLGCDATRERRTHAGALSTDYHASTLGCHAQLVLN